MAAPSEPRAPRGGVVIVQDGRVALIERVRDGRTYYVFPGGGAEPGETPERAAVREALEELGVEVRLEALLAVVRFGEREQFFYAAGITGGEFGAGRGEEFTAERQAGRGTYTPVWRPLAELPLLDVRPREVAAVLARTSGRL